MTISTELQRRYTTEMDVDWATALVISHPMAGTLHLIDYTEQYEGNVDGVFQIFTPVPIEIVPPSRDDSGRSDMSIILCGVENEALAFLYAAAWDYMTPITCRYSVFIIGDHYPQMWPWLEFQLSGIAVTDTAVTATASRANIMNIPFPRVQYRLSHFPGLRRR